MEKLFKYSRNILFVFGTTFVLCAIFSLVLSWMGVAYFHLVADSAEHGKSLFYSCVFAPLAEELFFRLIPITFLMMVCKDSQTFKKYRWFAAFIIAIAFAWFHGYGYWAVYIQGIGGFMLCYLYFKNGKFGYISAVIAHSLWNLMLGYILPLALHIQEPPSIFYQIK